MSEGHAAPAPTAKPVADNIIIPVPSTEFVISSAWDGGSILPGESLSRHRRSEPRAEHRPETRAAFRNDAPTPQAAPKSAPVEHVTENVAELFGLWIDINDLDLINDPVTSGEETATRAGGF